MKNGDREVAVFLGDHAFPNQHSYRFLDRNPLHTLEKQEAQFQALQLKDVAASDPKRTLVLTRREAAVRPIPENRQLRSTPPRRPA